MNTTHSSQAIAHLPDEDLISQLDPDLLPRDVLRFAEGLGVSPIARYRP